MRSRFSIRGHPLHPLMVALPIGLFVWAFVADIVYVVSDENQTWYDISLWSGIAAIVTALGAALPGFGDYLTIAVHSDARFLATAHMVLNLAIVILFAVAVGFQVDDGALRGSNLTAVVILHGIGVAMLAVSGALGGEMVYRHHLAMIPDDSEEAEREYARHGHGHAMR
jgi:uncharacterized membrane protein